MLKLNEQRAIWTGENARTGEGHCGYLIVHRDLALVSLFEGKITRGQATVVHPWTVYPLQEERPADDKCYCGHHMGPADGFCALCGQAYEYDGRRRPIPGSRWSGADLKTGKTVTGYPILIVEEVEMAFFLVDEEPTPMQYDTIWPLQAPVSASGRCPNCSLMVEQKHRFCPYCGQSLLWPDGN